MFRRVNTGVTESKTAGDAGDVAPAGADPLMSPAMAVARADGVAQAPDGSLYISDRQKGKIWRVIYRGGKW